MFRKLMTAAVVVPVASMIAFAGPTAQAASIDGAPVGSDVKKTSVTNGKVRIAAANGRYLDKMNHIPQKTGYWCGPATLQMMSIARGVGITQEHAARILGTTTNGTNAGALSGALRSIGAGNYKDQWIQGDYADQGEVNLFKARMVEDINTGYPMAVNIAEIAGKLHLPGHPHNQTIYHFMGVYGYSDGGNTVDYVDPAAKSAAVGWTQAKPYGETSVKNMADLVASRTYTW